jgi:cobyric acid synthase
MTINRLHKILSGLIARGHGRRDVCVDKATFNDRLEGENVVILPVAKAKIQSIEIVDGDGIAIALADGSTTEERTLVLEGGKE